MGNWILIDGDVAGGGFESEAIYYIDKKFRRHLRLAALDGGHHYRISVIKPSHHRFLSFPILFSRFQIWAQKKKGKSKVGSAGVISRARIKDEGREKKRRAGSIHRSGWRLFDDDDGMGQISPVSSSINVESGRSMDGKYMEGVESIISPILPFSFFSAQDSTEFSIGGRGELFPPLSFPGVVLGSEEFARGSLGEIPLFKGGKREMSEN